MWFRSHLFKSYKGARTLYDSLTSTPTILGGYPVIIVWAPSARV